MSLSKAPAAPGRQSSGRRMVTIKDIAERAQVSAPSVSLVLNGKAPHFREETREKVLKAARELGYRRNTSARNLRVGRFDSILLLSGMKHHLTALPTPLIEGIENTLHELKMSLIVDEMPDHELTSDEIMTGIMQQTTADGLLVNYHHAIPQQLIEIVVRHNIPAAWINVKRERDCAYPDDYQGSLLAVDKYLEMGLRDIVYVDYSHVQVRTAHFSASDRYHGYLEAMSRKGLVPRAFFNREPHVKPLYRHELAAEHLFSGNKPPEAIICYSPATACPILLAATAAGISIPESTRILSFHDEILVYHGLPLDTALIPLADLGKHVVELLLKRINTGQSLDPVSVSYKEPRLAQR